MTCSIEEKGQETHEEQQDKASQEEPNALDAIEDSIALHYPVDQRHAAPQRVAAFAAAFKTRHSGGSRSVAKYKAASGLVAINQGEKSCRTSPT